MRPLPSHVLPPKAGIVASLCFPSAVAYRQCYTKARHFPSSCFPAWSLQIPTTPETSPAHRHIRIHKGHYSTSSIRSGEQQNPKYSISERLRTLFSRKESSSESNSQSENMGSIEENSTYVRLFGSNKSWASTTAKSQPDLFPTLAKGQQPEILWIGCSDSRCPETTILGLQPGDVFVHRNIANILTPTDLNSLSVIQYAVDYLKVQHIVVCGHTSCGGVAGAMGNKRLGLIDTWLLPLRALRRENLKLLESMEPNEAALKLVELNVRNSVKVLEENSQVIDAVIERGLQVHGLIYDVASGELKELDVKEDEETIKSRKTAFKTEA